MPEVSESPSIGSRIEAFLDELRAIEAERMAEIHDYYRSTDDTITKTNAFTPIKAIPSLSNKLSTLKPMKPIQPKPLPTPGVGLAKQPTLPKPPNSLPSINSGIR